VDWQSGIVDFTWLDYEHISDIACQWTQDNPFSGPTICLRSPDSTPEESVFALGWIVDDLSDNNWDAYGIECSIN
jgi:hypothetical protein